jgi:arylsulfatase
LEIAGTTYPAELGTRKLPSLPGQSLSKALAGERIGPRTLGWEHEGNRAIRVGDWKLVAEFRGPWELYNLAEDRSETNNLAANEPERVKELAAAWQSWADQVGVVPWEQLPGANYKPSAGYSRKSEYVAP